MNKTVVLNVVGLSNRLIGPHTPFLSALKERGSFARIKPVLPALTCSAQATYLTGSLPSEHGIVGNGWYFRDECEVKFWRQANKLVQGKKLWEILRESYPDFRCANLFWWYNMYSSADYTVTPRPNYLADGRKIPDVYSHPPGLREILQEELGTFPLFHFWGPKTSIKSSQWIADAAMKTDALYNPTLTLVYLPHLDYNLQRHGLNLALIGKDLEEIDAVVQRLATYYESKGAQIVVLSEYGITNVNRAVHVNRILRKAGFLQIRTERGLELLDAGASRAFAVADHQIAHIYLKDLSVQNELETLLSGIEGVAEVLSGQALEKSGMKHSRCGDIVLLAEEDSWFTYYYWNEDSKAPDFARMVDIHKKPGYDPVEMFTDPEDPLVFPKIVGKLLLKKLGFRTLMDVIPLKPWLVKGSHGLIPRDKEDYPVLISSLRDALPSELLEPTEVCSVLESFVRSQRE